jgi:hypothetical protein
VVVSAEAVAEAVDAVVEGALAAVVEVGAAVVAGDPLPHPAKTSTDPMTSKHTIEIPITRRMTNLPSGVSDRVRCR